jgi:hypothetical protein
MEKEFIPYNLALALKELGFDEDCVACYGSYTHKTSELFLNINNPVNIETLLREPTAFNQPSFYVKSPTFSQAFRWFREKYGYFTSPTESDDDTSKKYDWLITKNLGDGKMFIKLIGYKNSYEEAELECLIKLIEICKKNK